jgi:decaprenylphospho-beta-D-ribofuranose 2-oxidase
VVPQGWFVPVTPGTRHVTIGGAIAADVHGKNHHRDGAFCLHVPSLRLLTPGGLRTIGPDREPDLFWSTAGGMGLTGIVVDATVRLRPIETSRILVDTDRTPDLDSVLALMADTDDRYHYSVAWIDLVARGRSLGRSVLTRGEFAPADRLPACGDPLAFNPRVRLVAPPIVPSSLLNTASIRAFNQAWYHHAPRQRRDELQTIGQFFHPLDSVAGWNRLYGRRGVLQWQPVVPFGAEKVLQGIVEDLSRSGCPSFLTVLKRFGPADRGPLSFPMPGWTLNVDIPAGGEELGPLLDDLDARVADAGGRVYLAKDSRMRPELVPVMYPRLDEWRAIQRAVDPEGVLCSDLARRLRLLAPR